MKNSDAHAHTSLLLEKEGGLSGGYRTHHCLVKVGWWWGGCMVDTAHITAWWGWGGGVYGGHRTHHCSEKRKRVVPTEHITALRRGGRVVPTEHIPALRRGGRVVPTEHVTALRRGGRVVPTEHVTALRRGGSGPRRWCFGAGAGVWVWCCGAACRTGTGPESPPALPWPAAPEWRLCCPRRAPGSSAVGQTARMEE